MSVTLTLIVCVLLAWWAPAIFLLWLPIGVAVLLAMLLAFVGMVAQDTDYWLPIEDALDKAVAAAFFRNGARFTVSAECGSRQKNCVLCKALRGAFDLLGNLPGAARLKTHFEDAARTAGLIQ